MKLEILLILILQVALLESLMEVSGYLGDTATLSSGANPSWNLSSIEWSIFSNNTWIATYRNGMKNLERVDRYKRRLSLNTSSGDLMIHNLTTDDAMEYSVDLINTKRQNSVKKTKLTVKQRLSKPTINVTCASAKGESWLWLWCSSTDKGAELSWQSKPASVTVFNVTNPDGNSAGLLAVLNTTQNHVEFTCTSSRNIEKASRVVTPKCDDNKPQPEPQPRRRYAIIFFIGGLLGGSLTVLIIYFFGKRIKTAWEHLKGKLFPSNDNNNII